MASFFAPFYSLFISPFHSTETGSKDEHSKNKWQNINCYKSSKILCMLSRFCVSNGTRSLSKNIALPSVQVGYVMLEKVAAPLSSSSASFNVSSVSVFIFKLPYLISWWLSGGWGRGGGVGWRFPLIIYTGRRCPKGYFFQFRIDYSTLFSTFDTDKLKKPMERTPLN